MKNKKSTVNKYINSETFFRMFEIFIVIINNINTTILKTTI